MHHQRKNTDKPNFQNIIKKLKTYQTVTSDNPSDTHFYTALLKWRYLNKSTIFSTFSCNSFPLVKTLPSLLYYKEKLFDLIFDAVLQCNSESLEPILDILVQFAYDLRREFCTNIQRTLTTLLNLTNSLECNFFHLIFDCITSLFKILSSFLNSSASFIINVYSQFLQNNLSSYIIDVASDGLSYYLKKLSRENPKLMLDLLIQV